MKTNENLAVAANDPDGKRRRPPLEAPLKAERVQEMLRALPEWRLSPGVKGIDRTRSFPSEEVAALYASFVTGFARAHGVPVYLHLYGRRVKVILHERLRRGRFVDLTERVVRFARQIR